MFIILLMLAYFNRVSSPWRNKGHILKILGTRYKKEAAHKCLFYAQLNIVKQCWCLLAV